MDGTLPSAVARPNLEAEVESLRLRLGGHIRHTPLMTVNGADLGLPPGHLALKLEQLQFAATFKTRAVFAELLTEGAVKSRSITVASQGNYGVAVAYAAQRLQLKARIFVPDGVPRVKLARIRGYGAEIVTAGRRARDVLAAQQRWVDATGAHVLRAGSPRAMLGCATLAPEIDEDCSGDTVLDTLLVPVGGGGLIAGLALGARPGLRLIGVEPLRAPTLSNALSAGTAVTITPTGIAVDTLGSRRVCSSVLEVARRRVDQVVLVSDAAILDAQRALWSELRLLVESGAAVGIAALQSGAYRPAVGERVGVLLTGANAVAADTLR